MKREILFRAKPENFGFLTLGNPDSLEEVDWIYDDWIYGDYRARGQLMFDSENWHKVNMNTVGQFTGLIDSNKAQVFEGDVLFVQTLNSRKESKEQALGFVELVKYQNGAWLPFWDFGYIQDKQGDPIVCTKVIGNIHDNPELLEKIGAFTALSNFEKS